MTLLLVFFTLLLTLHFLLIESYRRWFLHLRTSHSTQATPAIDFTVVIPARNEQANIAACLHAVLQQKYPAALLEVIVADDFSTDDTAAIVQQLQEQYSNLRLLQIEKLLPQKQLNSYKKKAIELAINQARGSWIVTTDADCTMDNEWLATFAELINTKQPVFIAAPVRFINTGSFVSIFQCLDFLSLQGITAASVGAGFHSMCNGANLAYSKEAFLAVGGFSGIDKIASGDDMLLMHKMYVRYPTRIHFSFSPRSIVQTLPMPTWRHFFNQRIRWAGKADKFDDKRILLVLVFIYLLNLVFFLIPFLAFFNGWLVLWWLAMLVIKTAIELRFMLPVAAFFRPAKTALVVSGYATYSHCLYRSSRLAGQVWQIHLEGTSG